MSSSTISTSRQFDRDSQIWDSLKVAIANSSGFECWQQERLSEEDINHASIDYQVRCYLQETLETLAY